MANIAIVCGAGIVSGKEIMALELITGLREQGYAVDVVTSSWGSGEFRRRCEKLGVRAHVMRLGFISATLNRQSLYMTAHQLLRWPGLVISYRRFLKKSQPRRVIHTNWHHLLLLAPFLKPERDLFWLHEVIPNKRQYRKFFRWLERHLQVFVAVSNAVAESLRKIGIAEKKIRVIHNGIADPASGAARVEARGEKLIVGIVGQIGVWKGHDDLLDAFAQVSPTFPAAQLHIFGKGSSDYELHLREKAASLGIAEKIFWRGFIPDRLDIYREMDICVVPSRSNEPLPTVAIEAAFFRIPVVATRQGGLPEIVENGVTGFLVDADQPPELASHLQTLLADDQLRYKLGENARRKASEKFNQKRFVADFVLVLESK
jgi:glycosyltransferase involved in cell wall biosynthesis